MSVAGLERVAYLDFSLGVRAGCWRRLHVALIARWCAPRLDRQLAAGASPGATAVLAARAQRIAERGTRLRVADGLARAVRDAQATAPTVSAAVVPHRQEVQASGTVLATLERRLRAPKPVTPRGVAIASCVADRARELAVPAQ
jgi:hypothetical protein